jgi:hypothetical protein
MTEIPEHLIKRAQDARERKQEPITRPLPPSLRQTIYRKPDIPPANDGSGDVPTETKNHDRDAVFPWHKLAVLVFGLVGGLTLATLYVWVPAWVTQPFFRGAGHLHSSMVKRAQVDWLTNSFWLWVGILTIVTMGIALWCIVEDSYDKSKSDTYRRIYNASLLRNRWVVIGAIGVVIALTWTVWASIDGAFGFKGRAQYYNQTTYYAVDDISDLPPSLSRLVQGSSGVVNDFESPFGESKALLGTHDVPSVVIEHPLSLEGWQVRNNSYQSAVRQMQRTSGTEPGSQLLADTVTYLPAETADGGFWTGIRDGRGRQSHIKGIIEWSGKTERAVNACQFEGEYQLNRALTGSRGNSLNHALFASLPTGWWYNMEDVYGFCSPDGEPIVVMPMLRYVRTNGRALPTVADVVLVHGSPSGDPRFERLSSVEPGQLPGPVYPISLSRIQREEANWAAGRKWHDNESFGYEPSNSETQNGNNADFLLKSKEDGRLYWVTPLTPNTSDSQLTIAYSVIPADRMQSGQLNDLVVYVMNDDDDRVTDFDRLESNVKTAITRFDSAFFATGGNRLQEFIPGSPGQSTTNAVSCPLI